MKRARQSCILGLALITPLCGLVLAAQTGDVSAIQQKLNERITLAKLDNSGEIVAAGSVITLLKGQLQMAATTAPPNAGAPTNTYKNGKLSAGMFSWNLGLGLMKIDPNSIPMHTLQPGEKFWIVLYNVRNNHVEFKILTDSDSNNMRYWTWLVVPFDKKQVPSPDQFMNTLAEVIAVDNQAAQQAAQPATAAPPPPAQEGPPPPIAGEYTAASGSRIVLLPDSSFTKYVGGGQGHGQYAVDGGNVTLTFVSTGFTQRFKLQNNNLVDMSTLQEWSRTGDAPAATPAPMPAIAPPPPPADTPPPTISIGQTMDQVTDGLGQPLKVGRVGTNTIFYYKDMKVTFNNGKVSDVE